MSPIDRQILLTLSYTQQFSYPLTVRELWERLLVPTDTFHTVSPMIFRESIVRLLNAKKLYFCDGFFVLPNQESTVATRKSRLVSSEKKRAELKPLLTICRLIPWICGVAITGSLAMNNADEHADADVMIITENNRLWLVRPLMVLFSFLYGKRRSWNREEQNSWCLNLWLERGTLSVPLAQRSVYTAHEVIQADWQVSKGGTAYEFFLANRWVAHYVFNYRFFSVQEANSFPSLSFFKQLFDLANNFAYQLQKWYMQPHMTKERVQLSSAFFHPRDTKSLIVNNWKKVITQL